MISFSLAPFILAVSLPALAFAHGSISDPMPTFSDIYNKNAPSAFKSGTPGHYTGTESIKNLADASGSTCGNTDANAAAVAAPSNGVVTFDISARSQLLDYLRWVWLATHNDPWEIFDNCVNVEGAGGTTDEPTTETPYPNPTNSSSVSSDTIPGTVAPANVSTSSSGACSYRGNAGNEQYDAWCEANCAAKYCTESLCEAC
ncbi:hypothetical protein V7S43_013123 [Phytophthora oleae]|uniref:Uncharacterized protein n=1 Tax=Phytophthora oleae TaxID=2107226 RepID=A0ABD3F6E0_9STRA